MEIWKVISIFSHSCCSALHNSNNKIKNCTSFILHFCNFTEIGAKGWMLQVWAVSSCWPKTDCWQKLKISKKASIWPLGIGRKQKIKVKQDEKEKCFCSFRAMVWTEWAVIHGDRFIMCLTFIRYVSDWIMWAQLPNIDQISLTSNPRQATPCYNPRYPNDERWDQ